MAISVDAVLGTVPGNSRAIGSAGFHRKGGRAEELGQGAICKSSALPFFLCHHPSLSDNYQGHPLVPKRNAH